MNFVRKAKKNSPPVSIGQYQDEWITNQNLLHFVSSFKGTSYKNLQDAVTRSFISCWFY